MMRKYSSFIALCVAILFVGIIFSFPISINVHSTGSKPPFLFALFFLITSLAIFIMSAYISFVSWFQGAKTRSKIAHSAEQLANRFGYLRFLVITNSSFLLWYWRFTGPVMLLFGLGMFGLVALTAF
jgi:hypothetical protein